MHGTYEQNKASHLRWREKNKERAREINLRAVKRFNSWKQIRFEFLAILL
jgi:hypothetical protein